MAVSKGQKITAVDYNELTADINKIFADNYPDSQPSISAQVLSNQAFGWGNIPANGAGPGTKITADLVNQIIDRVNISAEHTGSEFELDRVIPRQRITHSIWNDISTLIQDITPKKNKADVGKTALTQLGTVAQTIPFNTTLDFNLAFRFGDYDQARYFFNSSSQLKFYIKQSGGGAEDLEWQTAYDKLSTVTLSLNNTVSTTSNIISEDKGFEDLRADEQLLLSLTSKTGGGGYGYGYGYGYGSGGNNSYGYGGYGYGGYGYGAGTTKTIRVYGRIIPTQGNTYQSGPVDLILRVQLTDSDEQLTSGTHTVHVQSNKATSKTSGVAAFSIDNPTFTGSST